MSTGRYLEHGKNPVWTNGTGTAVVIGEPVAIGNERIGIAGNAIAIDASGVVLTEGVFTFAKGSETIAQGEPIFITIGAGTATAATNVATNTKYFAGFAYEAAATGDATVKVKLAPFSCEPAREITLAATGAQSISKASLVNGKGLVIKAPNTASVAVTLPAMATVPSGIPILFLKTVGAFAVVPTAHADDTFVGSLGTADAVGDRILLLTAKGGAILVTQTIA
jgi:predicted RecA/RadA family phage recombinase